MPPKDFDRLNLHELAHVEEHWDGNQDGTGNFDDPHELDDLMNTDFDKWSGKDYEELMAKRQCKCKSDDKDD